MHRMQIILLPGMDGTGEMFAPLLKAIPTQQSVRVIAYPADPSLGYDELLERVEKELAGEESFVLLAESFSGPLAVRFAAKHPQRVRALILCVSFVRFPLSRVLVMLAGAAGRLPPPGWALRWLLAGWKASGETMDLLRRAIRQVGRSVLIRRIGEAARVDARDDLERIRAPMLYLGAVHDRLVTSKRRREISAIRPDLRVHKIDAPHLLLQTAPAEVWSAIAAFLDGLNLSTRNHEQEGNATEESGKSDPVLLGRLAGDD